MTVAVRDVTAVLEVPEGFTIPAYDVAHQAKLIAADTFDTSTEGWDYAPWVDDASTVSATNGVLAVGPSQGSGQVFADRLVSLDSTRTHTLTGSVFVPTGTGIGWVYATVYSADFDVLFSDEVPFDAGTWSDFSLSVPAVAGAAIIEVYASGETPTPSDALYLDYFRIVRDAYTEHHAAQTVTSAPLDVTDGSAVLDEGWAPYGRAALTVAMPSVQVLDQIDPRLDRRVTIVATSSPIGAPATTRTFDLTLRDRQIDHVAATVKLSLATDEALLQDYANSTGTTDKAALVYQSSVRTIVDALVLAKVGASLDGDTSTADAVFTTLTSVTNQITNPSAQVDLTDATSSNLTSLVRQTGFPASRAAHGTGFRLNGSASSSDSWMNVGGGSGALRLGLQAGHTYSASGTFLADGALSGTAFAGRARSIVVIVTAPSFNGGVNAVFATSTPAPNAATTTRVSLTFTLPKDATSCEVRWYHGHASTSTCYWTDLMLVEGDGKETDTVNALAFFDGDTADTSLYNYQWSGTAGKSTSSRTPVFQRDPQTLWWEPGESAYDFIRPVLEQAGLRLFCDELRQWHLVDSTYSVSGRVTVAEGFNAYAATDTISRDARADDGSPLWFDSVVVKYTWNDTNNVQQIRYDVANDGSPSQTALIEYERPYPGPGAAAYILSRVNGQGRTLDLTAAIDYSATPGMEVVASLPFTEPQTGYTSSVAWDFGEDTMQVGTRGLTDTPANSWFFTSGAWSSQSSTWAAATT